MEFRAFEPGIEVIGQTVWAIVDGFILSKATPSRVLVEEGIGTLGPDGLVQIDRAAWYSQEAWLRAFEKIALRLGTQVLLNIGKRIPQNAIFPPWVVDVESAIKSIDIAYHLNHRKDGKVMFNVDTGQMLEGIGHYGFERPDPKKPLIISVCRNPYPCAFDRGILSTMARRFEATANIVHVDEDVCRAKGAAACTYHVKW